MDNQIIFRELLGEIRERAAQKGGSIDKQEVDEHFAHARLTPQQMQMIYQYLHEKGITVRGYETDRVPAAKAQDADQEFPREEGEEQPDTLAIYLSEIGDLPDRMDPLQEKLLFDLAARGDQNARKQLTMLYLTVVADMASQAGTEAAILQDLIQEGNIALINALEQMEEKESLAAYQAVLMNEIQTALQAFIQEEESGKDGGVSLARRMNDLREAAKALEEELGRPASAGELSAFLEVPEEVIRDLLGLTGE